jgi:hypothetical protein
MDAWMITSTDKWTCISTKDPVRVTGSFYFKQDKNHDEIPYQWIKAQMSARLSLPPSPHIYPIQVYTQWEGKKKPDLRSIRYGWAKSIEWVLVTLSISKRKILLADEDLWTCVLGHWYIADDEIEAARHEARYNPHPFTVYERRRYRDKQFQAEVRKSWEKIFDISSKKTLYRMPIKERSIMGWIWEIPKDSIIQTKNFRGALQL